MEELVVRPCSRACAGCATADLLARIDVGEEIAESVPHRRRYPLLNHRLARRIVQAHLAWLDEVEGELARPAG